MNIIGIDFGTTFSSAAWINPKTWIPEAVHFLDNGNVKLPSLVYYAPGGPCVGQGALDRLGDLSSYDNESERMEVQDKIVSSIKRILHMDGVVMVPGRGVVRHVEVVTEIFRKIKSEAEAACFAGNPVERAVITHPVSFTHSQKQLLLEAAGHAGIAECKLLEEPVAAAMGYVSCGAAVGNGILVYDFGGGTFDVAFVQKEADGTLRLPLEHDGDSRCGGDDMDLALYDHWESVIRANHQRGISAGEGQPDMEFLLRCRYHKESLSRLEKARFSMVLPPPDMVRAQLEISRPAFETLIRPIVDRTIDKTQGMLRRVQESGFKVDTVVLIGGSSRIPFVKKRVLEALKLEPQQWQYQDVAVALGAASHAWKLWMQKDKSKGNLINGHPAESPESPDSQLSSANNVGSVTVSRGVAIKGTTISSEGMVSPDNIKKQVASTDHYVETTDSCFSEQQLAEKQTPNSRMENRLAPDGNGDCETMEAALELVDGNGNVAPSLEKNSFEIKILFIHPYDARTHAITLCDSVTAGEAITLLLDQGFISRKQGRSYRLAIKGCSPFREEGRFSDLKVENGAKLQVIPIVTTVRP